MIDLETIEREISELETRDTSYRLCERLSWLYIVRDNLLAKKYPPNEPSGLKKSLVGSEFLEIASEAPYEDVLRVIDEHLEAIRILYPKTYENVLQRIRELR